MNKDIKRVSPVTIWWQSMPVVFEEWQGSHCGWTGVRVEESVVVDEVRGMWGAYGVGLCENMGSFSE